VVRAQCGTTRHRWSRCRRRSRFEPPAGARAANARVRHRAQTWKTDEPRSRPEDAGVADRRRAPRKTIALAAARVDELGPPTGAGTAREDARERRSGHGFARRPGRSRTVNKSSLLAIIERTKALHKAHMIADNTFYVEMCWLWYRVLNRRSQRHLAGTTSGDCSRTFLCFVDRITRPRPVLPCCLDLTSSGAECGKAGHSDLREHSRMAALLDRCLDSHHTGQNAVWLCQRTCHLIVSVCIVFSSKQFD
jgi:hypothetical protein